MKKEMFREMNEQEKRAKLLTCLCKKTNGRLTKEELETIVNNVDISRQYTVTIVNDAKEMAKRLTLKDHFEVGREEGCSENGKALLGKVTLGEHYRRTEEQFSEESENAEEVLDEYTDLPDFNIYKESAVSVIKEIFWQGCMESYFEIIIYLPETEPYEVDAEVKYILEHFNIK
ncbi:MAG: hypothetical protein HFJ27_06120 [Clostridia bacterium]|nr:hypothetical protein [Clostridia bacterium]